MPTKPMHAPLNVEQTIAIRAFASEHGAGWKTDLLAAWNIASAPGILHALRNSHGAGWLATFDPFGCYFVAQFAHHWGAAQTIDDAIANARACGGRGRDYAVKQLPAGAVAPSVDDMGSIRWAWMPDADTDDHTAPIVKASGKAATELRRRGIAIAS